ncbi:hypothetical protein CDN98_21750 [Roseateles terrae]|nr:hypothetical protein CDN98_21750 [Roseateles terrae]
MQQALYFTSDVPLRLFLGTDLAVAVRRELDGALEGLEQAMAPVDLHRRLPATLGQLKDSLDRDDDRLAQMLGHGKRWLTGLLRLLETHPNVDITDRRAACELLVDGFHAQLSPPATLFGQALSALRDRLPGGADARGFRMLLQQRVLQAMLDQWPQETGARKMSAHQRVRALMTGFGVPVDPSGSKSAGAALPVEQLNRAAPFIEERLQNQIFAVAHDLMGRLEDCYEGAARAPLPRAEGLSTAEDASVRAALNMVRSVIGVNLLPFLTTRDATGREVWHLRTSDHLADCIRAALPELSPPHITPPHITPPSLHLPASTALEGVDPASDDELEPLGSPSGAGTCASNPSSSPSSEALPVLRKRPAGL